MTTWTLPAGAGTALPEMVRIPAGAYVPFFPRPGQDQKLARSVAMPGFWLDRFPVTNAQFLEFVRKNPQWQKSQIKSIFSDPNYLATWPSDQSWGEATAQTQPVTNVSWFAATAFCRAAGKNLPSTDQWEYALADDGRAKQQIDAKILEWYGRPNGQSLPSVLQSAENGYGIRGLVGLVWEWTLDFNSVMSGSELRQTGKDKAQFCGGGTLNAADASDYAAFMRYSMRSSLKATYTTPNVGFRCAKD